MGSLHEKPKATSQLAELLAKEEPRKMRLVPGQVLLPDKV